ncbi:MAG: hypothetical protein O2828_02515 [Actinomycetota bacterium]|nr:hypothetical protein [Actinomycetota bacterium]MDA2980622.1 hypothetical protein [Actinomycetota bacterium]MDA3002785.1 hypothetical protein [Actinomycetota bacterium]
MDSPSEPAAVESSFLFFLSLGLGSLALVLAGVAVFLLLRGHDYFKKARYRSNRVSAESNLETPEP